MKVVIIICLGGSMVLGLLLSVLVQSVLAGNSETEGTVRNTCIGEAHKQTLSYLPVSNCNWEETNKKGQASIEKLISDLKPDEKPKQVFLNPTSRTTTSVSYKFPEVTLKPGESLYFAVPEDLQKGPVSFVVLGHRQDPASHKGGKPGSDRDEIPGLISFQVHGRNFSGDKAWRYWNGMASGNKGAKFAEVRSELEVENLYEWTHTGSTGVTSGDSSAVGIQPDGMRVISVGKDEVRFGEITLKIQPPPVDQTIEKIFTPGTSFDPKIGEKAKLGGGQNSKGLFPNAIALSDNSNTNEKLPFGWKRVSPNTIAIPVPSGKIVTSIEVLGGDSHPDQTKNKDGGWGTPGWAQISIGMGSNPAVVSWFVENENVPPEGLMMATPKNCHQISKQGDYVYVKGSSDKLYVMGVRVGLQNK